MCIAPQTLPRITARESELLKLRPDGHCPASGSRCPRGKGRTQHLGPQAPPTPPALSLGGVSACSPHSHPVPAGCRTQSISRSCLCPSGPDARNTESTGCARELSDGETLTGACFLRLHLFHKTEVWKGWAGGGPGPGPGTGLANGMIPECSWSETEDPPMRGTAWPISPISQNQSAIKGTGTGRGGEA